MPSPNSQPIDEWHDLFPFSPYPNQETAIDSVVDTLSDKGIYLLEGACGTGKTLIALVSGLHLIRHPDTQFDRMVVITSKKQQLAAFENDLEAINTHTDAHFQGLTLVGKAELCPLTQAGLVSRDRIYSKCIQLRDNTHSLMSDAVERDQAEREVEVAFGLESLAQSDVDDSGLRVGNAYAPFDDAIPEINGTEYCPFYASHITNSVVEQHPLTLDSVTTATELLEEGLRHGTCPHLEMRRLHTDATVVFGNYQHVFGPTTVGSLTGNLLDGSTLLVCDEAHNLVSEVRDQLSYEVRFDDFQRAQANIAQVGSWLSGSGETRKEHFAASILDETDVSGPNLAMAESLLDDIQEQLGEAVETSYTKRVQRHRGNPTSTEYTIPFQPVDELGPDVLTDWITTNGYKETWHRFLKAAEAVAVIKDVVAREVEGKSPDGTFPINRVYELLSRWWAGGSDEYFRYAALEPDASSGKAAYRWEETHSASIHLHNTIPKDEIAATLDLFGGTLLMSATLSPMDIYKQVTGVADLDQGSQPSTGLVPAASKDAKEGSDNDDRMAGGSTQNVNLKSGTSANDGKDTDQEPRRVETASFKLPFPADNRCSIAVDAPEFTYTNRWPPADSQRVREAYKQTLRAVATTTPGNVLVFMPSYREAEWAGEVLTDDPRVSKPVLTDMSSTSADTHRLKEAFFQGEPKILATSLQGTLVEGVDFDGDKLRAAVVCGVPLRQTNTDPARAVRTAYDTRFDGHGFGYAFAVPAVQKARQALGRVIRGADEVGVRVLVDERYCDETHSKSVTEYLPRYVRAEFDTLSPNDVGDRLSRFWQRAR